MSLNWNEICGERKKKRERVNERLSQTRFLFERMFI